MRKLEMEAGLCGLCVLVAAVIGIYSALHDQFAGATMAIAYLQLWHHIVRGDFRD